MYSTTKLLSALVLVVFVSGCAALGLIKDAETPEQRYHAVLVTFNEYDMAGLEIAQKAETPADIAIGLKKTRGVAKAFLSMANVSFVSWKAAKANLGENPSEDSLNNVLVLFSEFSNRLDAAIDAVEEFVDSVKAV